MAGSYTAKVKQVLTIKDFGTQLGRSKAHAVIGCSKHHGLISITQISYERALQQKCTEFRVEEPPVTCEPEHSLIQWPHDKCQPAFIQRTKPRLHTYTESTKEISQHAYRLTEVKDATFRYKDTVA
jgi:hypothetical protein